MSSAFFLLSSAFLLPRGCAAKMLLHSKSMLIRGDSECLHKSPLPPFQGGIGRRNSPLKRGLGGLPKERKLHMRRCAQQIWRRPAGLFSLQLSFIPPIFVHITTWSSTIRGRLKRLYRIHGRGVCVFGNRGKYPPGNKLVAIYWNNLK